VTAFGKSWRVERGRVGGIVQRAVARTAACASAARDNLARSALQAPRTFYARDASFAQSPVAIRRQQL